MKITNWISVSLLTFGLTSCGTDSDSKESPVPSIQDGDTINQPNTPNIDDSSTETPEKPDPKEPVDNETNILNCEQTGMDATLNTISFSVNKDTSGNYIITSDDQRAKDIHSLFVTTTDTIVPQNPAADLAGTNYWSIEAEQFGKKGLGMPITYGIVPADSFDTTSAYNGKAGGTSLQDLPSPKCLMVSIFYPGNFSWSVFHLKHL